MRFVILLSILLSFSVQAKETKTYEVPNCLSQARELAKRGTNIKTFTYGEINGVTFDTPTNAYTLSCKERNQLMTVEKWTNAEIQQMRNDSNKKIDKLAKQVL